jgi:hypothetical protein
MRAAGGEEVRLPVHQPVGGGIDGQGLAEIEGLPEAGPPRPGRRRLRAAGEHPERDLRPVAVERMADRPPAAVEHADDVAGGRRGLDDVGAVNPGVAVADPLVAASVDADRGNVSGCRLCAHC